MSIIRSLNTGASGLRAHSDALSVVGDNIANVNTVGFKKERAIFSDILGRSIAGAGALPGAGAGSRISHVEQLFTQGALMTTGAQTDLAISGNGFFIVNGNVDGVQGSFYSRAGQFAFDADGYVVNPDGLRLQGYPANPDGTVSAALGDLRVEGGTVAARATADVDMTVNLDSREATPAQPWDPANAGATSNYSTTTTAYDSLGNAHEVTVYFRNNGGNNWEWHAMVDGGETTGGTAGVPVEVGSGTLAYTTDGALQTETTTPAPVDFTGATAGQTLTFDFGQSITEGGTGRDGSTQYAADSSVESLRQDGYSAGAVSGVQVAADGTVTGVFTNGQRRTLGQVALADFQAVEGLERAGKSLWAVSRDSGEPLVGAAGSGGRGSLVAGALESSNVDIGQEFVDLIAYQRGFSANSKIITTADEMYQELVSLKR